MTSVSINGHTYSDDGTSARDMTNGGHRSWLLPMLGDTMSECGVAAASADAAIAAAASASSVAAGWSGTSSSTVSVGTGSKSITIEPGRQFRAGTPVLLYVTATPGIRMSGVVTAYNSSTGVMSLDVQVAEGAGTHAAWTVVISGLRGADGPIAGVAALDKSSAYTRLAGDRGAVVRCTGSWSMSFQSAAALGAGWWAHVVNAGSGTIVLDPAGSELIDGAASVSILPGSYAMVGCDGAALKVMLSGMHGVRPLPIFSAVAAAAEPFSNGETVYSGLGLTGMTSFAVLAAGASLVVASDTNVSRATVASSADGVTWIYRTMPSAEQWVALPVGSGFVAVSRSSVKTAYSADGVTWVARADLAATPAALDSSGGQIASVAGVVLLCRSGSTASRSTDAGVSWADATLPASAPMLMSCGALFVAHVPGSGAYYTSASGASGSWTARSLPGSATHCATLPDGSLYAWSYSNPSVASSVSTDAISWADTGIEGPAVKVGSVWMSIGSGYGATRTRHGSKWAVRAMDKALPTFFPGSRRFAGLGARVLALDGTGTCVVIDANDQSISAVFRG